MGRVRTVGRAPRPTSRATRDAGPNETWGGPRRPVRLSRPGEDRVPHNIAHPVGGGELRPGDENVAGVRTPGPRRDPLCLARDRGDGSVRVLWRRPDLQDSPRPALGERTARTGFLSGQSDGRALRRGPRRRVLWSDRPPAPRSGTPRATADLRSTRLAQCGSPAKRAASALSAAQLRSAGVHLGRASGRLHRVFPWIGPAQSPRCPRRR